MMNFFGKGKKAFFKRNKSTTKRGLHLENLEERQMLSVNPLIADVVSAINDGRESQSIQFKSEYDGQAVFGILVQGNNNDAAGRPALDPGLVSIAASANSTTNNVPTVIRQISNYNGTNDTLLLFQVGKGEYDITVAGENNAKTGAFVCDVFMPGGNLIDNDPLVSQAEANRVEGAIQAQIDRGFVYTTKPELENKMNEAYVKAYGVSMNWLVENWSIHDVNMDGSLNDADQDIAIANYNASVYYRNHVDNPSFTLTADQDPPVGSDIIYGETNPGSKFTGEDGSTTWYLDTFNDTSITFTDDSPMLASGTVVLYGTNLPEGGIVANIDLSSLCGDNFNLMSGDKYQNAINLSDTLIYSWLGDVYADYNLGDLTQIVFNVYDNINIDTSSNSIYSIHYENTEINDPFDSLLISDQFGEQTGKEKNDALSGWIYSCAVNDFVASDGTQLINFDKAVHGELVYKIFSDAVDMTGQWINGSFSNGASGTAELTGYYRYKMDSFGNLEIQAMNSDWTKAADSFAWLSEAVANDIYNKALLNVNFYVTTVLNMESTDYANDWKEATLQINLKPVNDAPIAVNDVGSQFADVTNSYTILSNDTDVDYWDTFNLVGIANYDNSVSTNFGDSNILYASVALNADETAWIITSVSETAPESGLYVTLTREVIDTPVAIEGSEHFPKHTIKVDLNGAFDDILPGTVATLVVNYRMTDAAGDDISTAALSITINGAYKAPEITTDSAILFATNLKTSTHTNAFNATAAIEGTTCSYVENGETKIYTKVWSIGADEFIYNADNVVTTSKVSEFFIIDSETGVVSFIDDAARTAFITAFAADTTISFNVSLGDDSGRGIIDTNMIEFTMDSKDVPTVSANPATEITGWTEESNAGTTVVAYAEFANHWTISDAADEDTFSALRNANPLPGKYFFGNAALVLANSTIQWSTIDAVTSLTNNTDVEWANILAALNPRFDADGNFVVSLYDAEGNKILNFLNEGSVLTLAFTAEVADYDFDLTNSPTVAFSVTIAGVNDQPAITANTDQVIWDLAVRNDVNPYTISLADLGIVDVDIKDTHSIYSINGTTLGGNTSIDLIKDNIKLGTFTWNAAQTEVYFTPDYSQSSLKWDLADGDILSIPVAFVVQDSSTTATTNKSGSVSYNYALQGDYDAPEVNVDQIINISSSVGGDTPTADQLKSFSNLQGKLDKGQTGTWGVSTSGLSYTIKYKDGTTSDSAEFTETNLLNIDTATGAIFFVDAAARATFNSKYFTSNVQSVSILGFNAVLTDGANNNDQKPFTLVVMDKLPPEVERNALDTDITRSEDSTETIAFTASDYVVVGYAEDEANFSSERPTREDHWYDFGNVRVNQAETTLGFTNETDDTVNYTAQMAAALDVLLGNAVKDTETGTISFTLQDANGNNIFDFLPPSVTANIVLNIDVVDKDFGCATTFQVSFKVTGELDNPVARTGEIAFEPIADTATVLANPIVLSDLYAKVDAIGMNTYFRFNEVVAVEDNFITFTGGTMVFSDTDIAYLKANMMEVSSDGLSLQITTNTEKLTAVSLILQQIPTGITATFHWNSTIKNTGTDEVVSTATHFDIIVNGTNQAPTTQDTQGAIAENGSSITFSKDQLGYNDVDYNDTVKVVKSTDNATFTIKGENVERDNAIKTKLDAILASVNNCLVVNATENAFVFTPGTLFDFLREGESIDISYNYMVMDAQNEPSVIHTIKVTVNGVNTVPVIIDSTVEQEASVVTDENTSADAGALAASDIEDRVISIDSFTLSETSTITNNSGITVATGIQAICDFFGLQDSDVLRSMISVDNAGHLVLTYGESFQKLNVNETLNLRLSYQVKNDADIVSTDSKNVLFTVNGLNQAPVANDTIATAMENGTIVFGTTEVEGIVVLNASDIDHEDTKTIAKGDTATTISYTGDRTNLDMPNVAALDSMLSIANNQFTFTAGTAFAFLRDGESVTIVYRYIVTDALKASSNESTLTITLTGTTTALANPNIGEDWEQSLFFDVFDDDVTDPVSSEPDPSLTAAVINVEDYPVALTGLTLSVGRIFLGNDLIASTPAEFLAWFGITETDLINKLAYNSETGVLTFTPAASLNFNLLNDNMSTDFVISFKFTSNGLSTDVNNVHIKINGKAENLVIADDLATTAVSTRPADDDGYVLANEVLASTFADRGRVYTFTATNYGNSVIGDNLKLVYNDQTGKVSVYVKKTAMEENGMFYNTNAEGVVYNIGASYTDNSASDVNTFTFNLTVRAKAAPIVGDIDPITGVMEWSTDYTETTNTVSSVDFSDSIVDGENVPYDNGTWCSFGNIELQAAALNGIASSDLLNWLTNTVDNTNKPICAVDIATANEVYFKMTYNATTFDFLGEGDTLVLTYTFDVIDTAFNLATTKTIQITVTGINNIPVNVDTNVSQSASSKTSVIDFNNLGYDADDANGGILADRHADVQTDTIWIYGYTSATGGTLGWYQLVAQNADNTTTFSTIWVDSTTKEFAKTEDGRAAVSFIATGLVCDYSDAYYSLVKGQEKTTTFNYRLIDKHNATAGETGFGTLSVKLTGDYVAPEFTTVISEIKGTVAETAADGYVKTQTYALNDYLNSDLSETTRASLVFTVALTFKGKDDVLVTIAEGQTITDNLPDMFKSVALDANGNLTVTFIEKTDYDRSADYSPLTATVSVTDTTTKLSDKTDFDISLKERYTSTIALVAATSGTLDSDIQKAGNEDDGYWARYATDEYLQNKIDNPVDLTGLSKIYLQVWIEDYANLYFDAETGLASAMLQIEVDKGTVASVANWNVYIGNSSLCTWELVRGDGDKDYITIVWSMGTDSIYGMSQANGDNPINNFGSDGTALLCCRFAVNLVSGVTAENVDFDIVPAPAETVNNTQNLSGLGYRRATEYTNTPKDTDLVNDKQIELISIKGNRTQMLNAIGESEKVEEGGIYIRTVTAETKTDSRGFVDTLATNVDYVNEWQSIYAEIWVKASERQSYNFASVDFSYDNQYFNAVDVELGSSFIGGSCAIDQENGTVTGIGGSVAYGSFNGDGYVLLARVKLESVQNGGVAFADAAQPHSLGWELSNGLIKSEKGVFEAYLGNSSTTELWGISFDTNDDGYININDFYVFCTDYGKNIISNDTANAIMDFNNDGYININDFYAFCGSYGANWSTVVSGEKEIEFPETFTRRYIGSVLNTEDDVAWVGAVLDAANQEWKDALGLEKTVDVQLVVMNLEGSELAKASVETGKIYIDDDALGYTWYSQLNTPDVGSTKYDLYSVLLHELGHLYGYEGHSDNSDDVMSETLNPGERKSITTADIQGILGTIVVDDEVSEAALPVEVTPFGQSVIVEQRAYDTSIDSHAKSMVIDLQTKRELNALGLDVSDAEIYNPNVLADMALSDLIEEDDVDITDEEDIVIVPDTSNSKTNYEESIDIVFENELDL